METLSMVSSIVTSLLLLFGFLGNVMVTLILSRKDNLDNPYTVNLALLDLLVTLSGPATNLVTVIFGSDWLANHVVACDVIGFLNTNALLGSAVALFFLGEYSRHAQNFSILRNRRKSKKYLAIGISWLLPLVASLPPLIGWGSFRFDSSLRSCVFYTESLHPAKKGHVYCFLLVYFLFSLITCVLSKQHSRQLHYPAQVNWEMHMLEMRMNDPECTTAHSTSSTLWSERRSIRSLDQVYFPTAGPGENTREDKGTENGERSKRNERDEGQRGNEEGGKGEEPTGEEEAIMMKVASQEDGSELTEQQQATYQKNGKVKELQENCGEKQPGGGDGNGDTERGSHAANPTPEDKDHQSAEQESCDPTLRNLEGTKNRQRLVPKPLELPTQEKLEELYLRPHRLQSPRILHSPVVNQNQREMITFVLLTAFLSLIGCLLYAILNVLQLVSVRCPEMSWALATWLLYARSAISPVAYYRYISEYRRGFGREFSKCCICCTAGTYEGQGTARQEDMLNHVAFNDPQNVICRSIIHMPHTGNL